MGRKFPPSTFPFSKDLERPSLCRMKGRSGKQASGQASIERIDERKVMAHGPGDISRDIEMCGPGTKVQRGAGDERVGGLALSSMEGMGRISSSLTLYSPLSSGQSSLVSMIGYAIFFYLFLRLVYIFPRS